MKAAVKQPKVFNPGIDALKDKLSKLAPNNIEGIARVVGEMEELGVSNFSPFGLQSFYVKILRKVRDGTTIPEVLVRFASKPEAAIAISHLPVRQQKRLAGHPFVDLVHRVGKGFEVHSTSVYDMSALEIQQMFSGESIRSIEDQQDILSNPDIDGTVKGTTRTINIHVSHHDYATINRLRMEHDMTKCAYLRAVLRGELPPPLAKRSR